MAQGTLFDLEPLARRHDIGPKVSVTRHGLYLPEADLWLDPQRAKPAAFVSHAHSDHARPGHEWALATPATHAFMAHRKCACPGPRLEYGQTIERNGCKLSLIPAGHVLGSAQLVADTPGGRVVYTGDCKLRGSRTAGPPAEVVPCDVLIIEATFALPIYRFPGTAECEAAIVRHAHDALADGETPVFLGYTLGKGPEIAKVLLDHGLPVRVWSGIRALLPIYQQYGVDFSGLVEGDAPADRPHCLVMPPSARDHNAIQTTLNQRIIYVSGWACLDSAYDRAGADRLVPMSDHFDWPEIWEYIARAKPRRVVVTHGYCEPLARELRRAGIPADAADLHYGEELAGEA